MRRTHAIVSGLIVSGCFSASLAAAEPPRQSVSLYVGPATRQFVSEIVQGHFSVDGTMLGLAYDRQLADLGGGFTLQAEGQATHFFMSQSDYSYSTLAAGLGVQYDTSHWIGQASSFTFYTGPSWSNDTVHDGHSSRWLEYVSLEFAIENIGASPWDGVIRMFHRSGAFGLYGRDTDTGSMFGIGIRRRF